MVAFLVEIVVRCPAGLSAVNIHVGFSHCVCVCVCVPHPSPQGWCTSVNVDDDHLRLW